ncbi:MAG: hypothetical protein HY300_11200, partial [Verrucomicrobia bacterium]|nr:hypothetical protein [Verrucomicrobiota bacterium]
MHAALIETSLGCFAAKFSEAGLAELHFPSSPYTHGKETNSSEVLPQVSRFVALTEKALKEALAGKAPRALPP